MPYAIYSKRTGVISRIVHDLSSLLPSESMIEVDDEVSYPRSFQAPLRGQKVNTFGMKVFEDPSGEPTIRPYSITRYTSGSGDRPGVVKNTPTYEAYYEGANPKQARLDLPIYAHPFGWKSWELAQSKYESILAKNYPYQVVIGEEWIDEDHIDTSMSEDYVTSEGKLILLPGGTVRTTEFWFRMHRLGAVSSGTPQAVNWFAIDTYYCIVDPVLPPGVKARWGGHFLADPIGPSGVESVELPTDVALITDQEVPTRGVPDAPQGDGSTIVHLGMHGFYLEFENTTPEPYVMENYTLFLRAKDSSRLVVYTP